ncbi:phosphoribosylformylglycinamidine synthase, purS protein [Thermoplasma sp. Kam2015]|uniref:phosphoribosylformylglycinamidine synthase subunit PurS n=1 Tax=Thermoplasma sp. Kam2015 TaxID=2094122 RepID=UPI000D99B5F9|nr:phosphoribosylformylglycinamidine synthase subunit PurS [Thermoplasma sp. Kam2015]PYB68096.1 phosphoribosylformylglycinamidine synthase, purS protein [Thermoplasma sp. Kam2015]
MKFRVEIRYKEGVEDPEAVTILKNFNILGYKGIKDIKTSKVYYIEATDESEVYEVTKKILANPVIHTYSIGVVDGSIA